MLIAKWNLLRTVIFIIVVCIAFVIRLSVAVSDIPLLGDAKTRYDPIANNLLDGHGFSRDRTPPRRPDNFDQPGYPVLVASIYAVSSRSTRAVVLFQLLLDLLVLLPVLWICRELKLSRSAQILAVGLGLVSPYLAKYAGLLLSEVVATLVITISCYAFLRAVRESGENKLRWWVLAGVTSGICLLIRADTLIIVALMSVTAIILARQSSGSWQPKQAIVLILVLVVTLAPWTIRNYVRFKSFKPLGGVSQQAGLPYVKWLNTWFDDPADLKTFWWEALKDDNTPPPFPDKIPDDERSKAAIALLKAREQKSMNGEPALAFQELAAVAVRRRPLDAFVVVPVKRLLKTWSYPQVNKVPELMGTRLPFLAVHGLWLLLWVFAMMGVVSALWTRRYNVLLVFAILVGRLLLPLISSLGADPRLLVETLPALYVLSALGFFTVWDRVIARDRTITD
jgi:4-amino-4-deoxy-L-arabinose transferase-like glycosyltransferase